ncbi:MAG: DUF1616 domain-containing protein [Promethearchaeota archaeon]
MNDFTEDTLTLTIIQLIEDKKPRNLEQLVNLAKEKFSIPEQKIIEHVLRLQSQGRISLTKQPTRSQKLIPYLKTEKASWYWVTIVLIIASVIAVFTIPENAYPIVYLRYVLGIIFVLWLPGYSLIKALFPEKELDNIERTALSIGMSLALVPITGLILHYTPWGIETTPVTLSLLVLTAIFATAAIIRQHRTKTK